MLPRSLSVALEWLGEGRRVIAATLVESLGSAPLEPGAEMLVDDTGRVEGSVTGGCVEGALVEEAQGILAGAPPRVATYGISDEQAVGVGLMCGGTVRVFVGELTAGEVLAAVRDAITAERPVALATLLDGPAAGAMLAVLEDGVTGALGHTDLLDVSVARDARGFLDEGRSAIRRYSAKGETMGSDLRVAIRAFATPPRMVVFGAIDFSAALAAAATEIGYRVTIVDARQAFAASSRFSAHADVVVSWPQDYLADIELGPRDAVLVFTHDPKFDEPALVGALATQAGYIGALGSRRTHGDREDRLRAAGIAEEQLARVSSPCGLDVGARTPAETAVAVLAEILALRAGRGGGRLAEASGPIHSRAARRVTPTQQAELPAMEPGFANLLIVVAAGFAAPLALGMVPRLRFPSVVLELLLGIAIGPAVLGWVTVDEPVRVLSLVGLAILLFLAGLEIEFDRLRGRTLRVALLGYGVSVGIALVAGVALHAAGLVRSPVFIGVLLSATSLGVLVPVLKDSGNVTSTFGQLVIAASSIADFAAVILLSLFFSREATSTATKLILLGALFAVAMAIGLAVAGVERSMRLRDTLVRLQDTTAQIRVRGAFVLLIGFVALASKLGLEVILGAFLAGALLTLVDRDRAMTHPQFRLKLEAVGFGVFIPVFFVTSGVNYDLDALTHSASTLLRVPIFLVALMLARGVPALLYRGLVPRRQIAIAAIMQATSLPFIVAGTAIGRALGVVSPASAAALVAAGLVSVLVFPALSLSLLKGD